MAYVNGVNYNMTNISIAFLSVRPKSITKIMWSMERDTQAIYGVGAEPVSLAYGKKTYSAEIELSLEDAQSIYDAAQNAGLLGGDNTAIQPFDVVITYGDIGSVNIKTHILKSCVFLNQGVDASTSNPNIPYSLKLLPGFIDASAR